MKQTGIMLLTPGKSRFWHPCQDAETGLREMAAAKFAYGDAWGHKDTILEFGESDGSVFAAKDKLTPPWGE